MDRWDETAADAAGVGQGRTAGAAAVYEHLYRYGMRDFRSIGHKAIYVANSRRTLACIGWQHAEPVLRSLAYALLMHEGDNPSQRDADADRPFRRNSELVEKIPNNWLDGEPDAGATTELLAALRTGSNEETCDAVVEVLNRGVAPQSVWDALHLAAGELLMRQPAIVALHAVTTTNALRYAFTASGDDRTRRLLVLQNAAFLPMFREAMGERGAVKEIKIDDLAPAEAKDADAPLEAVFAELGRDRAAAASMVLGRLKRPGAAQELIDAARVLNFMKGNDAHDYKFSSAVLEDYFHVSPEVRDRYLAGNIFKLNSTEEPDNTLVQRTRAALGVS
jgi:hypothetical protein